MNLKRIFLIAFAVTIVAAVFSKGYHHFDEHFQLIEFANYKSGNTTYEKMPWEYKLQMRPTLQPTITYGISETLMTFGIENPFVLPMVLRILSGLLSLLLFWRLWKVYQHRIKNETLRKWFVLLSLFTWFIVYNHVRFSSENWSGMMFIFAAVYFVGEKRALTKHFIFAGIFLGLSILFRYQSGFLVIGIFFWLAFIYRAKLKDLGLFVLVIVAVIGIGSLIDGWFYGEWTLAFWNYFYYNIIYGKAAGFGVQPWYYYFEQGFIGMFPLIGLFFITAIVGSIAFRNKTLLTGRLSIWIWAIIPFILLHMYVGHKELRFLFPIVGALPFIAIELLQAVHFKKPKLLNSRGFKVLVYLFWGINLVFLLVICFKPATDKVALYQEVYNKYDEPIELYVIKSLVLPYAVSENYLMRDNVSIHYIASVSEIDRDENCLIAFEKTPDLKGLDDQCTLVFQSLPDIVYSINFGGWVERSRFWRLYEYEGLEE